MLAPQFFPIPPYSTTKRIASINHSWNIKFGDHDHTKVF